MTLPKPLALLLLPALAPLPLGSQSAPAAPQTVFGYRDFSVESAIEEKFLAVPDAKLAGEELKTLTAEPHLAATPEDHKTAEFVAQKFRAAGLDTEIVPYRVLMNQPKVVRVEAFDPSGKSLMTGPTPFTDPSRRDPVEKTARGSPPNSSRTNSLVRSSEPSSITKISSFG